MPRPRVLTELDEWPRHQTIDTFNSVAAASPEWSDGYWHCFGDPAGEVNLITAIRLYPNTNVMDAYAIVSPRRRQAVQPARQPPPSPPHR